MHKAVLAITIAAVTAGSSGKLLDARQTIPPHGSARPAGGHHICGANILFDSPTVRQFESVRAVTESIWCDESNNVVGTGAGDWANWQSFNSSVATVSPNSNAGVVYVQGLSVGTTTIRAYAICGGYYNGLPGCADATKTITVTTGLLDGSISGPGVVSAGATYWWTANVYGGTAPYTIQWPGGATGTTYSQAFTNIGEPYNTVLYVNVSDNGGQTKQLSYNVRVCPTGVEDC